MSATRPHNSIAHSEVASDPSQSAVVLVEDREEDIEYAKFCLSEAGFKKVVVFNSPHTAIEYLTRCRDGGEALPKGLLLDLLLNRDNGFEVLRFCHSQPCLQSVPVVVWTQLLGPTEKEIAHWLGARKFLNKGTIRTRMTDQLRSLFSDQTCVVGATLS